jgi:adenine phosphoribosyltransferase
VIKLAAIREALAEIGLEAELLPVSTASGVPEQPFGDETVEGALNRALAAQATHPGTWAIGIENGVFDAGVSWRDYGVIQLVSPEGKRRSMFTDPVTLLVRDVEEAKVRGFATTTVGSVMAEQLGCDPMDPHAYLSRGAKTRKDYLREALVTLLSDALPGESHRVTIGHRTLFLPVVSVNESVSVALFNLLGDWRLTDHCGERLANLIPGDVEALVMPDGKAQALLHVMGRRSNLPTYVARKELKPYMRDAVSTQATSITSGRVQTLFLDGRDAACLRARRVAVVDDVVSTGSTLDAMLDLLRQVGASHVATMTVFTEGDAPRDDVISLGHLPLFRRA